MRQIFGENSQRIFKNFLVASLGRRHDERRGSWPENFPRRVMAECEARIILVGEKRQIGGAKACQQYTDVTALNPPNLTGELLGVGLVRAAGEHLSAAKCSS